MLREVPLAIWLVRDHLLHVTNKYFVDTINTNIVDAVNEIHIYLSITTYILPQLDTGGVESPLIVQ